MVQVLVMMIYGMDRLQKNSDQDLVDESIGLCDVYRKERGLWF